MSDGAEILSVELGARAYDIHVGGGLLAKTGALLAPVLVQPRAVVVTDENVAPLYLEALRASLDEAGIAEDAVILPPGEQTKSFASLEALVDGLLTRRIERRTSLIALGGGVIGDLCGFAAAIVLRGVPFVQVPTTLLAQVDSSVGGKTAIDTPLGKNLVGAFHQPAMVIADMDTLVSLPAREIRAGLAEVIKYGLIDDAEFFAWCEKNLDGLLGGDAGARAHAVAHCCRAKAAIVAEDETESGRRQLLNLGHTFAHALESEAGFSGVLLHGEAVAMGLVWAFELSARLGLAPPGDAARVRALLTAAGLAVTPRQALNAEVTADALLAHMQSDKKVRNGKVTFILARGIGKAFIAGDVMADDVRAVIADAI